MSQPNIYEGYRHLLDMGNEEFEAMSGIQTMEPGPSADDVQDLSKDKGNNSKGQKKRYRRHTEEQIQRLEDFFRTCPMPDGKQKMELSRELGLEPWQIKFWYQNKRTRMKVQYERHENAFLKAENEKLWADVLATTTCHNCGGRTAFTELYFDNRRLRDENARLKERLEKISAIATKNDEEPLVSDSPYIPPPLPFQPSNQFPTQLGFVQGAHGRTDLIGSTSVPPEGRDMQHHEWNGLEGELVAMMDQFDPGETPNL